MHFLLALLLDMHVFMLSLNQKHDITYSNLTQYGIFCSFMYLWRVPPCSPRHLWSPRSVERYSFPFDTSRNVHLSARFVNSVDYNHFLLLLLARLPLITRRIFVHSVDVCVGVCAAERASGCVCVSPASDCSRSRLIACFHRLCVWLCVSVSTARTKFLSNLSEQVHEYSSFLFYYP